MTFSVRDPQELAREQLMREDGGTSLGDVGIGNEPKRRKDHTGPGVGPFGGKQKEGEDGQKGGEDGKQKGGEDGKQKGGDDGQKRGEDVGKQKGGEDGLEPRQEDQKGAAGGVEGPGKQKGADEDEEDDEDDAEERARRADAEEDEEGGRWAASPNARGGAGGGKEGAGEREGPDVKQAGLKTR